MSRASAEIILIITVLLWSGSYTASRYAVTHGFEPIAYSAVRFAIGSVIFVAVVLWREGSMRIEKRDLGAAGAGGSCGHPAESGDVQLRGLVRRGRGRRPDLRDAADLRVDPDDAARLGAAHHASLDRDRPCRSPALLSSLWASVASSRPISAVSCWRSLPPPHLPPTRSTSGA